MSLTKKVRSLCRLRAVAGYGVTCGFIKVNQSSGMKLYAKRRNAMLTHEIHSKAAALGLAPPILSSVFAVKRECVYPKSHYAYKPGQHTYYGYLVGLATLSKETLVVGSTEYERQLIELKNDLFDAGFGADDMGSANWGHYRGRPVCLDFSHFEDIQDQLAY